MITINLEELNISSMGYGDLTLLIKKVKFRYLELIDEIDDMAKDKLRTHLFNLCLLNFLNNEDLYKIEIEIELDNDGDTDVGSYFFDRLGCEFTDRSNIDLDSFLCNEVYSNHLVDLFGCPSSIEINREDKVFTNRER
jgi:hypothetical protein